MLLDYLRTVELREPHTPTQTSFYSRRESAKNCLHSHANNHYIHCHCESSRLTFKTRISRKDRRQVGDTAQLGMMRRICEALKTHRKVPLRNKRQENQDSLRVVLVSDLQRSHRLGMTTIQSRKRAIVLIPHHEPRKTHTGTVPLKARKANLCLQPRQQLTERSYLSSRAV